jgi:hypothetical protein
MFKDNFHQVVTKSQGAVCISVMKNKHRNWIRLAGVSILVICLGLILYPIWPLPVSDPTIGEYPDSYAFTGINRFDVQGYHQCSAYATAFLMKNLGFEADGESVYRAMDFKIPVSGYVLPRGVLEYLRAHGQQATLFRGTVDNLKVQIASGKPVLVIIGRGVQWQHYMCMVGYNEPLSELYFYDSGKKSDENGSRPGNRTMRQWYFESLWANGLPVYHHLFIAMDQERNPRTE